MQTRIKIVGIVAALAFTPALSLAQSSSAPLTRAEVRAQLIQLEQAGYNPARRDNATYPRDIQAAEARVAANEATAKQNTGMGGSSSGTTQTGHRLDTGHWRSMYGHH